MTLGVGTRLGAFEITGELGAGGMGEVYRATDTNLKRDVAIKILPSALAEDADRLARFRREAEVLASLNHPNIAQIYGLERSDGATALVMELVEGPTLAERIAQGPIPPDEALPIAMQIADALEAAHGRGIVHRDLKPANIELTADGAVKVLDFGIAKALETQADISGSQTPSLTIPAMTQAGILLGTAGYMSPEQARGKAVDERADIWAFGCAHYEMLTGQPAFGAEDVPMTLARVLANDTDLKTMPGAISPAVRHTIKLCLEKDVRKRIADVRDVKLALQGAFEAPAASPDRARWARPASLAARWLAPAAAIALVIFAAFGAFWPSKPTNPVLPETRLAAALPAEIGYVGGRMALSPDGRYLLLRAASKDNRTYAGVRLWLWRLDSREARPLPGTEGAGTLSWSADARFVLFSADDSGKNSTVSHSRALKALDIVGGSMRIVTSSGADAGQTATRDEVILFTNGEGGISRVPASGGAPTAVTKVRGDRTQELHELPVLLPDRRHFLYLRRSADGRADGIYVGSLDVTPDEQPATPLVAADDGPLFVPDPKTGDGYLLFARKGTLLVQRFDPDALALTGDPVQVATGVSGDGGPGLFSISADGSMLVYWQGLTNAAALKTLVWVDRNGVEEPIPVPPRNYNYADLSPDARHIALDIREPDNDIWIWDVERKTLTRLTADEP